MCFSAPFWIHFQLAHKSFCPLCNSNALTRALALSAVLRQTANMKMGSNTGGGDLGDWNQTFFHLVSAMPAHTLMLHFPPTHEGGESPQREICVNSPCLSLLFISALTGSTLIEIQIKINSVMCFSFTCIFSLLWWKESDYECTLSRNGFI